MTMKHTLPYLRFISVLLAMVVLAPSLALAHSGGTSGPVVSFGTLVSLLAPFILAHCDGVDGPVVRAAQKALETGDVNHVLIWIPKQDEAQIRNAFQKTLAVRKLNPEAQQLAELYFFETLVRIHRAGEGAPYTGLKPAGRDLGPAIPAADAAIASGSDESLINLLTDTVRAGIRRHFTRVMAKKNFTLEAVESGREYVEEYVTFVHYIQHLYNAAKHQVAGHSHEVHEGHKD